MYTITTITSKGQVTIPDSVREALKIQPGDKATFSTLKEDVKQMVVTIIPKDIVQRLSGSLASPIHEPDHAKARRKAGIALGKKYDPI